MLLEDFVKVHPKAIPDNVCDYFIDFFKQHFDNSSRFNGEVGPFFNQIDFTSFWQTDSQSISFNNSIAGLINSFGKRYVTSLGISDTFPSRLSNENLRIKKYSLNDLDQFPLHIDANSSENSSRCLAMLLYLNDVEEGGETIFPNLNLIFKPTKGTLLIFPPTWMFPHIGAKPISNEKYILSTYWHMG
jgi:prolyl 4-hydroxylase